jgi:chromosome segregation protein
MRLKRVRIFGFKTFADRTEFSLDGGVIAVVGPNGCGKSNLVDAILWGLGEGNARHLRAVHNQDVIFSGASNRKPVGYAEVSLLFDNEDGKLPVDTPEVSITRKLTRAGDSEYSINKQNCRLRDIYDLLADSGLGRAGYSIVGQKEIDSALSASAEERRGWIDEAAGVQRYRTRKVESLRRLATAQEHLERVTDILNELEAQRGPLRQEAEIAHRYKAFNASLREVEIGLLIDEVSRAVQELKEQEARIEEAKRVGREEIARAEALEEQVRASGVLISDLERELDTIRGLQQGSLTALERAESQIKLLDQRLVSLDEQSQLLQDDGSGIEARILETEKEVTDLTVESEREGTAFEELKRELAGVGAEAEALSKDLKDLEKRLDRARKIHALRLRREAEEAHRADRLKQIRRELHGIEKTMPDLTKAIAEAQAAYDGLAGQGQNHQRAIKDLETRLLQIRQDEEKDAQNVRYALADKASLEGRKRGIEATIDAHEGLTQGTRAVLEAIERGLLRGEYTPVGQAVETDRDYALAIETALGASSNDLICNDSSDAKTAIEWLKQHRAGRATFQPIPLMRPVEPSYELRRMLSERGVLGRASELVTCLSRHRPVIDSLLGRVVIVDTIDTALRLAKTTGWSRLVSLEGEVVHGSGAVTGGQQSRQGYGLVQRKADLLELTDQLEKLEKTIREFDQRSSGRGKLRAKLEDELLDLRDKHSDEVGDVDEAREFLQTLLDEHKSAERSREKLARELAQLEAPLPGEEELVDLPALEVQRDEALKVLASRSADAEQAESKLRDTETRYHQSLSRLQVATRRLQTARDAEENRKRKVQNLEPEREKIREERLGAERSRDEARLSKHDADLRLEDAQARRRELLEASLKLAEASKSARANAASMADVAHQAEIGRARAESRRAVALQRLYEEYGLTEDDAREQEGHHEVPPDAAAVVNRLKREIKAMGDVNLGAIEAYERLSNRFEELEAQRDDVLEGISQVESSIRELDKLTRERFLTTFEAVQTAFTDMFQKLFGGGEGKIALSDPERVLESGIDLLITLPGKKRQALQLLSGGERSLCAMAFLFSLLKVKPSPLVVLDEVDAPLDGRNVERFGNTIQEFTDSTQFIVITHNPTTIEMASVWLGVTMQDPGVSTLIPAQLSKAPPIE